MAVAPGPAQPKTDDFIADPTVKSQRALGSYALGAEIGRGGMGVIYRAVHHQTGRVVALKTVLPQHVEDAETLARFEREAEAASSLIHPNLMPIHEVGKSSDGLPFFCMDLAPGGSLHQLKGKYHGRWRQIVELLVKITAAIQYAHERGILHRDLKPGNILFTADHEPLVTDFGLAKRLTSTDHLTLSCAVLGTPSYVAPEQAAGKTRDITPAADVYSLGAIFYELLTGRPPFIGDNPLDVMRQAIENSPEPPRRLVPQIPKLLDTICMRCLEVQPTDRYGSAQALANDLEAWLVGRKIVARPPFIRWWRRFRSDATLGAFCLGVFSLLSVPWAIRLLSHQKTRGFNQTVSVGVFIENLDPDPSLRAMAEQATSELRSHLSRTSQFEVEFPAAESPASAEAFDPVSYAHALNAQSVLTGSIRRSGDQIHLTIRFLRTDNREVIWHQKVTSGLNQFGATLPQISQKIVDGLQRKWRANPEAILRAPVLSSHADAVALYTKARELAARTNQANLNEAIIMFQRAIALDPNFASAHALLGYSFLAQVSEWKQTDKLSQALSEGKRALELDPDSAMAHRVLGGCYFKEARYEKALEEWWEALELNPQSASCNVSLGDCLREMGHPDQALPWIERAVKLDPAHGAFNDALAETLILTGADDRAEVALRASSELDPEKADSYFTKIVLFTWQQNFEQARHLCAECRLRFPDYRHGSTLAAMIEFFDGNVEQAKSRYEQLRREESYDENMECFGAINPSSALAFLARQSGDLKQAEKLAAEALEADQHLLDKLPRNSRILHDLAATWNVKGDSQMALRYLKKAIESGWVEHRSTMIDPRFRSLHDDPEFTALLKRTFPKLIPESS